jgi:hypothetical protein
MTFANEYGHSLDVCPDAFDLRDDPIPVACGFDGHRGPGSTVARSGADRTGRVLDPALVGHLGLDVLAFH